MGMQAKVHACLHASILDPPPPPREGHIELLDGSESRGDGGGKAG